MQSEKPSHSAGIGVVAFLVAAVVSLAYYQFTYVPEANAKPILAKAVLNPKESVQSTIVEGAWQQSSPKKYVPKEARGVIGVSNKVVWTNTDAFGHTVTSTDGYVDKISGKFDSNEQLGKLVMPGETFEFIFTNTGEFYYGCVPHPQMQGVIEIADDFS